MARPADGTAPSARPVAFVVLVVLLAVPSWVLGEMTGLVLPANLPVSALMVVSPFVAAVALVARDSGAAGVRALFARMVDVRELSAGWAVAGLLVMPGVLALASVLQRLGGRDLPGSGVPLPLVPALLVVFLVGALAEQTGWTGYLQEPVRRRLGTLPAAAAVGGVWGLWHVVPYLQANSVRWTVWQVLFTVLLRVVVVWAYDGAGRRAPVAVLVHAGSNVGYAAIPGYDPAVATAVTAAVVVGIVALSRGSRRWAPWDSNPQPAD